MFYTLTIVYISDFFLIIVLLYEEAMCVYVMIVVLLAVGRCRKGCGCIYKSGLVATTLFLSLSPLGPLLVLPCPCPCTRGTSTFQCRLKTRYACHYSLPAVCGARSVDAGSG